ncbi:MAG: hypothetical protein JSV81_18890 [Anaerolineales bacterium]|nr:MAG: hypothetical protein JSV81_18890 [Anaerolineales bacterium]
MEVDYPDIISEYLVATERYESDGVQIAPYLEPAKVAMGETANLVLFLQNAVDAPVELTIEPVLPQSGRLRGSPMLAVGEPKWQVALEPAQVGVLFVPITTTPQAKEGQHPIHLNISGKMKAHATRIRYGESKGRFRSNLIDDVVGLNLVRVVGVPYKAVTTRKISMSLTVQGEAAPPDQTPDLATRFDVLWNREEIDRQYEALQEVSQRRAIIIDQLQTEPLYVGLFGEGHKRFADAGLPLRVGEAVALGKILTYTVRHFLANSDLQDGLLVPMWDLAKKYEIPTGDPLWVLRNVGFQHLLRLSVALSFGLVHKALGRQPWTLEERRAVISLVADTVEAAELLPPEFLYIPLMMAAAYISDQIILDGEDSKHSLRLLQKAKSARADVFGEPDLDEANLIFDRLLNAALQA